MIASVLLGVAIAIALCGAGGGALWLLLRWAYPRKPIRVHPPSATTEQLNAALRKLYSPERVAAMAERPHPLFALLQREAAACDAKVHADEERLDRYGYGGREPAPMMGLAPFIPDRDPGDEDRS